MLHPEVNVAKMHAGIPLTDADRRPWLERVAAWKRSHREVVIGDRREVRLVYLRGGRDLVAEHLAGRSGHFMPNSLLQSQIDTLEEPGPEEGPLIVDLGGSVGEVAAEIIRLLGASAVVRQNVRA
jgi:gluconate kinase